MSVRLVTSKLASVGLVASKLVSVRLVTSKLVPVRLANSYQPALSVVVNGFSIVF